MCRWFDSDRRHQKNADVAHLVERHLAKVEVASSSLVIRSIRYHSQVVRPRSAKPLFAGSNPGGTSKKIDKFRLVEFFYPLRKQWHIISDIRAIVVSHQSVRTVYHHALACIKKLSQ